MLSRNIALISVFMNHYSVALFGPSISEFSMFKHSYAFGIAVIYVTKSRTGNYDFRACARARGFPGSTLFGRTHMLHRVCRAITR